jgi:hypothetical protein
LTGSDSGSDGANNGGLENSAGQEWNDAKQANRLADRLAGFGPKEGSRMRRFLPALVLLVGCVASPSSPAPPPAINLTGPWTGRVTSAIGLGTLPASMILTQTGTTLAGTWKAGGLAYIAGCALSWLTVAASFLIR